MYRCCRHVNVFVRLCCVPPPSSAPPLHSHMHTSQNFPFPMGFFSFFGPFLNALLSLFSHSACVYTLIFFFFAIRAILRDTPCLFVVVVAHRKHIHQVWRPSAHMWNAQTRTHTRSRQLSLSPPREKERDRERRTRVTTNVGGGNEKQEKKE